MWADRITGHDLALSFEFQIAIYVCKFCYRYPYFSFRNDNKTVYVNKINPKSWQKMKRFYLSN